MSKRTPHRAPALLQWIGQTVSFIVLCISALAAVVLIVVPLATGSQTYSVLTSSMAPHYAPGTFLVVKPQNFDTLAVGDVITYQIESGRPEVITHRIITVTADQADERILFTQGDNNAVADPEPVREVQVRGALFYAVPYVGFVANALGQTQRGPIITLLAIGLIGYGVLSMGRGVIRDRRDAPDTKALHEAEKNPAETEADKTWSEAQPARAS
ncbi:signal peptidase I [Citricoccus sp. NPDC079358]|uniref:signal peptidase I n=1 Tax=Citricoccus sp. NPDC079358 TaxID=3154653 RepID=UPI00344E9CE9